MSAKEPEHIQDAGLAPLYRRHWRYFTRADMDRYAGLIDEPAQSYRPPATRPISMKLES